MSPDGAPRSPPTVGRPLTLLTGVTGYVGGRLLDALLEAGVRLRCLARNPERLAPRARGHEVEVVKGDVLDPHSLAPALEGVNTAYYLIHSLGGGSDYREADRRGAAIFGAAAKDAGVQRIIYLGGLGGGEELSEHLESRQEVGRVLRHSGVEVIELRASIILGSGSLSFEMIRALVEKLPVMITPRWVDTPTQPIGIEDVIRYLVAALEVTTAGSQVFEIGGADRVSYGDLMREYARQRGLRRWMIRVPVLSPRLSSLWLGLVTPLYARVGRELIDGLRNETTARDALALATFTVRPMGMRTAITRALAHEDRDFAATRWSDAFSSSGGSAPEEQGSTRFGSRLVDSRARVVSTGPKEAFRPIARIGGDTGWYFADWLWHLRGFLDLVVGGPGIRRGRRDPAAAAPGDALDFWRVEAFEPDHLLRLRAEMRLPGRAWLQFEVNRVDAGSEIRQTAIFDPVGLPGLLYWYGIYPLHRMVFRGMLRGIVRAIGAEGNQAFKAGRTEGAA